MSRVAGLEVSGVAKAYGQGRMQRAVIRDCSFAVEPGRVTVLIGPSGCGKSSLVRLLAGYEQPDAGRILIDGSPVRGAGPDRLVVFQESALFPWMTTQRNVMFGAAARGGAAGRSVADVLQRVGLSAFGARYPAQLSGGMQRRAELARALAAAPAVMILDEPFRGLDAMTRHLMVEYYAGLIEAADSTHLFVTTDADEAVVLADTVLVMSHLPMRVLERIDIDLPRPRRIIDVASDDRANAMRRRIIDLMRDEVVRSFGERMLES